MSEKYSAFSYKAGNSFVHKLPAIIKILLIPVLSVVFFKLPLYWALAVIAFQFVLALCIGFSVKEVYLDLKPVLYFAVMLYFMSFLGLLLSNIPAMSWKENLVTSGQVVLQNTSTALMLVKLFAAIQISSIVFKTSTSLEIRGAIGMIEGAVRKVLPVSKKNTFTDMLSLFVCFIPLVFKIWNQSKLSWKARGGKVSVKMYMTLFPVLFSVGMKSAWNSARAIAARVRD